jgi:phosphopantothenoylcysteine decarboxylase
VNRILVGATGSVAAVKAPELATSLSAAGHKVRIVTTEPALAFFDPSTLPANVTLYRDADEWPAGRLFTVGEPVLHIELHKWADALLIAPLDANTLAKLALGLSDNLLTCVYRAWDFTKPVVLAPAMNTFMWENPATRRHLRQLLIDHAGPLCEADDVEELIETINRGCPNLQVLGPVSKVLACGDEGMGGMATVETLVSALRELAQTGTPTA